MAFVAFGLNVMAQKPLVYGNDTIFLLADANDQSAEERSIIYNFRLAQALRNNDLPSDSILLTRTLYNSVLVEIGDKPLLEFFSADSALNNEAADVMGFEMRRILQELPKTDDEEEILAEKNPVKLILQSLVFLGVLLICGFIYYIFTKLYHYCRKRFLGTQSNNQLKGLKLKNFEFLSKEKQFFVFEVLLKIARVVLTLVFIYLTIPLAFALFPETSHLSGQLFSYILKPLGKIGGAIVDFMPEMVNIALVIIVVTYALRFFRYLTTEISEGKLKVNNFRAEWAKPTFHLIQVLVYLIAALIVLPIFAFANSSLFLGFLAFVGLALAIGSGASVANFVAGVQIAFMRPFEVGDFIKVGETSGEVVDTNLIVTRLKTRFNEIVSLPNVEILKFHTVNYSASNKDLGLIVYTNVKVKASADIEKATALLVEAAGETKGVMENPRPYVMKLGMHGGLIELQINLYVQDADKLYRIKSALLDNIHAKALEQNIQFE